MEWYRKIGFKDNPVHIEPQFGDALFGCDLILEEIYYRIQAGSMIFLEGEVGKTALLMKIIEKYRGEGRVAFVDCKKYKEEPDLRRIIKAGKKAAGSQFPFLLSKGMIVLLDNVKEISPKNAQAIKFFFDSGDIRSVVLTGRVSVSSHLPLSIRHRIGKRVYHLRSLSTDEIVDIVLERTRFQDFLKEEEVYILALQLKTIKELLKGTEKALKQMIKDKLPYVTREIAQVAQ